MSMVADLYSHVVGVDTHARTHTFTILTSGRVVETRTFPTHRAGLARAADWIARRTQGEISGTLICVEGTSSYGAQLTALLAEQGYRVVEAPTPKRGQDGKTDGLDSHRAAHSVLNVDETRLRDHRQHGGDRDVIAALATARGHYTKQRTGLINRLTALLRANDLGVDARHPLKPAQITKIANWRTRQEPSNDQALREIATDYAKDILALDQRLNTIHNKLLKLTHQHNPELLAVYGVGPVTAAIIISAYSHHGRIRSQAAFAKLAGVAPIPASSGNTHRHRLSRGGDRRLNWALHQIIITRLARDPETKAYAARRRTEGKTNREIQRCLKRYLARQIYRTLNTSLDKP